MSEKEIKQGNQGTEPVRKPIIGTGSNTCPVLSSLCLQVTASILSGLMRKKSFYLYEYWNDLIPCVSAKEWISHEV